MLFLGQLYSMRPTGTREAVCPKKLVGFGGRVAGSCSPYRYQILGCEQGMPAYLFEESWNPNAYSSSAGVSSASKNAKST